MINQRYINVVKNGIFKDNNIHNIFLSVNPDNYNFWGKKHNIDFCLHYSAFLAKDISWYELCDYLKINHSYKLAIYLMNGLLEQGLYKGEHSDLFYSNKIYFDPQNYCKTGPFHHVFCFEDVSDYILNGIPSNYTISTKYYYSSYNFIDDRMLNLFKKIRTSHEKNSRQSRFRAPKEFMEKYSSMRIEDISWCELCNDADLYKCHNLAFSLIFILLENNEYYNDFAASLYEHFDILKNIYYDATYTCGTNSHGFMCAERIEGLFVLPSVSSKSNIFLIMNSINPFIRDIFFEFYLNERDIETPHWYNKDIVWFFEESFGRYRDTIHKLSDFNEYTFWEQINWFKNAFSNDEKLKRKSITVILSFYRWLFRVHPDVNYFANATSMSSSLIFTNNLHTFILKDYFFTTYEKNNHPLNHERILFILYGYNKYSTKIKKEDFFAIDLSMVKNSDYRNSIIKYIVSFPSANIITNSYTTEYIIDSLNILAEMKVQPDYPNKSFDYFTNQEAVLLRNRIESMDISRSTKNSRIYALKDFFTWCYDSEIYKFDDLFFDYLKSSGNQDNSSTAEAIPDDIIAKIITYMMNDSCTNPIALLHLAITRLLIETKFRIGTICNLSIDCIRPTVKPNQYRIIYYHKTGHGEPQEAIINDTTYRIIMNAIEDTEDLREEILVSSLHNYIFLHKSGIKNHISKISVRDYRDYLKYVCHKINVKEYTPSNLRDTHMTKALEYAIRNNKSDLELSILTGHRNISTTKNNYIDWKMEEMLEATYGLDLSTSDYLNRNYNIAEKIPDNCNSTETIVENGCGNCTAQVCHMKSALPCLLCKDFITTIEHQEYFEKAIEGIQRMIDTCQGANHDIEDLITMKKLYVSYLGAILQKKESIDNE